jgi:hypothetical protein
MRPVALFVLLAGCSTRMPVVEPPVPEPVAVDAPLEIVASAVREEFTMRKVDFDARMRASTDIASDLVRMEFGPDVSVVTCGASIRGHGYAKYAVHLASDGQRTLVAPQFTFRRQSLGGPLGLAPADEGEIGRCASLRTWEVDFARAVKARAEGRPLTIAVYTDTTLKPYIAAHDGGSDYYVNASTCRPLRRLPGMQRRYFASESEAIRVGLRRSSDKGC